MMVSFGDRVLWSALKRHCKRKGFPFLVLVCSFTSLSPKVPTVVPQLPLVRLHTNFSSPGPQNYCCFPHGQGPALLGRSHKLLCHLVVWNHTLFNKVQIPLPSLSFLGSSLVRLKYPLGFFFHFQSYSPNQLNTSLQSPRLKNSGSCLLMGPNLIARVVPEDGPIRKGSGSQLAQAFRLSAVLSSCLMQDKMLVSMADGTENLTKPH